MLQYFKIVDMDESNCLGILGIANILTEYGKVHESKEIYKLIQSCETDPLIIFHSMLNNAHLLINQENQEIALNMYQAASLKYPNDKKLALYLCKAYYKQEKFDLCVD